MFKFKIKKDFLIRGIENDLYHKLKLEAERSNQSLNNFIKQELKNNLSSKTLNKNLNEKENINEILIEVIERNNFLISLLVDKINSK